LIISDDNPLDALGWRTSTPNPFPYLLELTLITTKTRPRHGDGLGILLARNGKPILFPMQRRCPFRWMQTPGKERVNYSFGFKRRVLYALKQRDLRIRNYSLIVRLCKRPIAENHPSLLSFRQELGPRRNSFYCQSNHPLLWSPAIHSTRSVLSLPTPSEGKQWLVSMAGSLFK